MKQKIIEVITLLGIFLVTVSSCSKGEDAVVPGPKVVSSAVISLEAGDDAQAKASYDHAGRRLYWQEGDQLVLYSNDNINGILYCSSVDGDRAIFSGTISNFTPGSVNVYFFGNKPVDSGTPDFDFSLQNGNAVSVSHLSFLKSLDVEFVENAENQYKAAGSLHFDPLTCILNIKVDKEDGPVPTGTKARSIVIDGLMNRMTVNLATGVVTPSYVKSQGLEDLTMTKITPRTTAEWSTSYLVTLIPQSSENVSMIVNYADGSYNGLITYWNVIKWTVAAGKSYSTNWTKQGDLNIMELSSKDGYAGVAIDTGENADGTTHKGGYGGIAVDNSDNPNGQKNGYSGTEVY